MSNEIPHGATHINPLICEATCQYVKVESNGLYFFREKGNWVNVNGYKANDLTHLIKL